jgi:acyl dehydratase
MEISFDTIVEREFVSADQERFASICGDRNPMHMDALAARRTLVGFPVVHGIHVLLWGLDSVFRYITDCGPVASIKVSFEKMIYVGDRVKAVLAHRESRRLRLEMVVEGIRVVRVEVALGDPQSPTDSSSNQLLLQPAEPLNLTFEQMITCHGTIPFHSARDAVRHTFPAAANALGVCRVAALAGSSFLIGMVCPGLHSIYRGLTLVTTLSNDGDPDGLHFRVVGTDSRFRLVKIAVSGGGWMGSLDAHARPEPAAQAEPATIAARVVSGEFKDASALVVGGSRGLGELISKIVSVGGGHVTLTYSVGEEDARRVAADIIAYGGCCDIMHYDVRQRAAEQLSWLRFPPTQLYYMATPVIARRSAAIFSEQRLQELITFYVTGFHDLCKELRSRFDKKITIFYPSSTYVEVRPAGMTEYAMAKAAAEALCADIQRLESPGPILVRRLPRLPTDQTASVRELSNLDPIDVILPIIREVYAAQRPL